MNSKGLTKERRNYAKLAERIFNEDKRIRFVAIYGGRDLLSGGMRSGVSSYDLEEAAKQVDLEFAIIAKSAKTSEQWFGRLNGIVMYYEKLNLAFSIRRH